MSDSLTQLSKSAHNRGPDTSRAACQAGPGGRRVTCAALMGDWPCEMKNLQTLPANSLQRVVNSLRVRSVRTRMYEYGDHVTRTCVTALKLLSDQCVVQGLHAPLCSFAGDGAIASSHDFLLYVSRHLLFPRAG